MSCLRKIKPLTMTKVKNKSRATYLVFWKTFYSIHSKKLGDQANLGSWFSLTQLGRKRQHRESGMSCSVSLTSVLATAELVAERCCSLEISQGFRQFHCTLFLVYLSVNSSIRHPGFYGRILNSSDIALITVV